MVRVVGWGTALPNAYRLLEYRGFEGPNATTMTYPPDRNVESRTAAPGICLIVVGVLNMALGVLVLRNGFEVQHMTLDEFRQMLESNPAWGVVTGGKKAAPTEDQKSFTAVANVGLGVLNVLGAVLTVFAGVSMRSLSRYGLAVAGAVWALIPFLSLSACCGIGEIVGIWALVVLLGQEVRSAFQ